MPLWSYMGGALNIFSWNNVFSPNKQEIKCIYNWNDVFSPNKQPTMYFPVEMMFQTNFVCVWKQRDEASLQNSILLGCILCGYRWRIMPHLAWCHSLLIYTPMPFSCCQLKTWNTNMPDVGRIMHSILILRISPFYTKSEFPFQVNSLSNDIFKEGSSKTFWAEACW